MNDEEENPFGIEDESIVKTKRMSKRNNKLPPGERMSFLRNHYSDSIEADWKHYPGAGWVYKNETDYFSEYYAQSIIDHKYYRRENMLTTISLDANEGWICRNQLGKDWDFCQLMIGSACKKIEMVDALDDNGLTIKVHPFEIDNFYFTDQYDGRKYLKTGRIPLTDCDIEWISTFTFNNSGKFNKCGVCNKASYVENINTGHGIDGYLSTPLCKSCAEKIESKKIILAHDSKEYPSAMWKPTQNWRCTAAGYKRNTLVAINPVRLFGCEVEVEFDQKSKYKRHQHALFAMKALGKNFIRIKHDGSLAGTSGSQGPGLGGEFGFEIVTGPCDLQTHRENWPRFVIAEGYNKLRAWDTNTCGFHVHVTREALTTFQISRMVTFANHPNNKSFIQKIAGRSEEKYCKYFPKKASDVLHPESGDYNERRRVAINLQNEKTVEFRIFRGTINPRHIIRNIEFCDALCDFCHPASRSLQDTMDPFKFIEFVANARTFMIVDRKVVKIKKWPILYAWFEHHGAIKKRKTKDGKSETILDEEAGPSSKYRLPEVLVDHSIGIKTTPLCA